MVRTFWPKDTDTEIYVTESASLGVLVEIAKAKWPGVNLLSMKIEAVYIQTNCIGYDLYDASDYTRFIKIQYNPGG